MTPPCKFFYISAVIFTSIGSNFAIYREIIQPKTSTPVPGLYPNVIAHANISQVYNDYVNQTTEFLYEYDYTDDQILDGGALRVFVRSDESYEEYPVLVVVRHEKGVLSWQIPLLVQSDNPVQRVSEYRAVNRTLCPLAHYQGASSSSVSSSKARFSKRTKRDVSLEPKKKHRLTVSISSAIPVAVAFQLNVYIEELFKVEMGRKTTFAVSPSAPQYFEFHFPVGVDTALVAIHSEDDLCMTVSVQNISCPVYDLDRNVQFQGLWQTVDTKTGISIRRDMFPMGLHLVFVVKPDNMDCNMRTGIVPRSHSRLKEVEFSISKKITKQEYLTATFGAFGMFVGAYLVVILVSCIMCVRTRGIPEERSLFEVPSIVPSLSHRDTSRRYRSLDEATDVRHRGTSIDPKSHEVDSPPSISGTINDIDGIAVMEGADVTSARNDASDDSSIDETDIDMLVDADFEKDIFRTKTFLYISDLARKSPRVLAKKSQLYQWNLLTMAIFYGLPVFQLCMTYQQVLNQTGNQDLCYYNFLCSHPLGLLSDFNHVYSNIGYVMLGGLFIVLTWRRDLLYARAVRDYPQIDRMYGVPQHPGMFYAMGLALMMEGLMSGCYHICPNHSNFQFDTAFMYTISILCMLKIYQSRHPDINANAYTSFGVLAFVIFVSVIGVVTPLTASGAITFWTLFTVLHVVSCIILSIQIYYMGRWKVDSGLCKRVFLLCSNDCQALFSGAWRALKPTYLDRAILLLIFNLANWGLASFGVAVLAKRQSDFAGYLLAVFIMNLLLYTLFYIVMKLRHGERLTGQPLTYMLLAIVSWTGALYFFINKRTSWILPPAQSKHLNQDCTIFHFYDNHDIWHFLSATSLFLNFMMLLTLDDDLYEKPRDKIPVF